MSANPSREPPAREGRPLPPPEPSRGPDRHLHIASSSRHTRSSSSPEEYFMESSTDSSPPVGLHRYRPMPDIVRSFQSQEREIRLAIREEELEARCALPLQSPRAGLSHTPLYRYAYLSEGLAPNFLQGPDQTVCYVNRPACSDHPIAALCPTEQLQRLQLQIQADYDFCALSHQALAGVEAILSQKQSEHTSRLEVFHRVSNERLIQCRLTSAMNEDRSRELQSALQAEQRLRLQGEETVQGLRQIHHQMDATQTRLVEDLHQAHRDISGLVAQLAQVEARCTDLQQQLEGHKALQLLLRDEVGGPMAVGTPPLPTPWGCSHQ